MKIIDDEPTARPRPRTDNAKTELSSQRPFVSLHPAKDSLPEGYANSGASSSRYLASMNLFHPPPRGFAGRGLLGKCPGASPRREPAHRPGSTHAQAPKVRIKSHVPMLGLPALKLAGEISPFQDRPRCGEGWPSHPMRLVTCDYARWVGGRQETFDSEPTESPGAKGRLRCRYTAGWPSPRRARMCRRSRYLPRPRARGE